MLLFNSVYLANPAVLTIPTGLPLPQSYTGGGRGKVGGGWGRSLGQVEGRDFKGENGGREEMGVDAWVDLIAKWGTVKRRGGGGTSGGSSVRGVLERLGSDRKGTWEWGSE